MVCVATLSAEVVNVAAAGLPDSVPDPILTPPSRKLMVPVAGTLPLAVTVAVKVTDTP